MDALASGNLPYGMSGSSGSRGTILDKVKGDVTRDPDDDIKNPLGEAEGQYKNVQNAPNLFAEHVREAAQDAEKYKKLGNEEFASGNFTNAMEHYDKAMRALKDYPPAMLEDDAKKCLLAIYNNASQASLKLCADEDKSSEVAENAQIAREMADKALVLESTNVKARFRRGCAFVLLEDWSQAQADFEWTLRQEPGNAAAKQELQKVLRHSQSKNDKEAKGSWEKAAAAAMKKGQCEDTRSSQPGTSAPETSLAKKAEQHIAMADKLKRGAAQYFEKEGDIGAWNKEQDDMAARAEEAAEIGISRVKELEEEGEDLKKFFGDKAELFGMKDQELRRRYIQADAFISTVQETFSKDFDAIVKFSSTVS